MTAAYAGTYTAIATPFTAELELDLEAFGKLIDRQADAGVEGIVVLGTTGEAPTVHGAETESMLRFAVERAAGRLRVIAGVGGNDTVLTLTAAQQAADCGVDALLVTCPYYNKPSQNGLFAHFSAVADAVDLPQIVYNIQGRTGVNIATDTIRHLSAHRNIVGVKESSEDINQIMDVVNATPDDFAILSGADHLTYSLVALGGHGTISTISNIVPAEVKAMVDAGLEGAKERSLSSHYQLMPLMRACFVESNPIPLKAALAAMGLMQESYRPPLCAMEPANHAVLMDCLSGYGLISHPAAANTDERREIDMLIAAAG